MILALYYLEHLRVSKFFELLTYKATDCTCKGLPWLGKSRKNRIFSRSRKSQEILYQVREMLNSTSKSVKRKGILFFVSYQFWEGRGFLCWKRKCYFKRHLQRNCGISVASFPALLVEKLSFMDFEKLVCDQ